MGSVKLESITMVNRNIRPRDSLHHESKSGSSTPRTTRKNEGDRDAESDRDDTPNREIQHDNKNELHDGITDIVGKGTLTDVDKEKTTVPETKVSNSVGRRSAGNWVAYSLPAIIILGLAVLGAWYAAAGLPTVSVPLRKTSTKPNNFSAVLKTFNTDFSTFRNKFASQKQNDYMVISAAVKDAMQMQEPEQPACILVVGDSSYKERTNCFANKLADLVHSAFAQNLDSVKSNKVVIQVSKGLKDDEMRKEMEPVLQGQSHAVLVKDMEQLDAKEKDFFHVYCDNVGAPVRRMVMVVTVSVPDVAQVDIFHMWRKQIPDEVLEALSSRIGNNMVVLDSGAIDVNCEIDV